MVRMMIHGFHHLRSTGKSVFRVHLPGDENENIPYKKIIQLTHSSSTMCQVQNLHLRLQHHPSRSQKHIRSQKHFTEKRQEKRLLHNQLLQICHQSPPCQIPQICHHQSPPCQIPRKILSGNARLYYHL